MPPSWRLALNNLTGRRGRTALMAGAVALAGSLIVAVSCAIASAQKSLEFSLTRFVGAADARIIHPAGGRFDEKLLTTVRRWPEVQAAVGRFVASVTLTQQDRHRDGTSGQLPQLTPRATGVDFSQEEKFRHFELIAGRMPAAGDEIIIDPLTAEELHAQVGDVLTVNGAADEFTLTVAGIYARQKLGMLQQPRIYLDRHRLGQASGWPGQLTSIHIILRPDEDVEAFCTRHLADVPQTLALEPAEMVRTGFNKRVKASRIGLIIASVLTFMSAAIIIVIGLTTSFTERQREMALLRCLGAKRVHLFASQLMVGLLFGVIGAVIGIPLGIGLTRLLVWFYADYLPAGLAVSRLGLTLALAGSLGAGLAGALYPAIFASRVAPLEAMRRQASPVRAGSIVACTLAALALIALQLILMLPGDDQTRFWAYVTVGVPSLFIGCFLLAVPLLLVVTVVLARPLSWILRLPRDLLRGSMLATPFRHGLTAGALMVGMAILVDTWACGISMLEDWIDEIRFADGFAFRPPPGITPEQQRAIAELPFVKAVCPIGYLQVTVVDRQVFGVEGLSPANVICVGFDPERFFSMNAVDWPQGDPEYAIERLKAGDGLVVAERFLTAKNIGVGDRLTLGLGRVQKELEVVGVVSSAGLDIATQLFGIQTAYTEFAISCVFMDFQTVGEVFDSHDAYLLQMNLAEDISDEEATRRIMEAAPGVMFRSGRWIKSTVNEITLAVLAVDSTVAFAALVLACLAVGNVIAANIHGRRFEYGVLRAVGARRATLGRLILAEAGLLAVSGALVGTLFGYQLAWMDARNLRDLAGLPVGVDPALGPVALGWLVLIGLTLLAALPGTIGLMRHQPGHMLSTGRND